MSEPINASDPINAVWNALLLLCDEADHYVLHTRPDDPRTIRSAGLAAAALEYAAAHLEGRQANHPQAQVLRDWAEDFRRG